MKKHQFARLVKCKGCGAMVGVVYATAASEGRRGAGLCESCEWKVEHPKEQTAAQEADSLEAEIVAAVVEAQPAECDTTILSEDKPAVVVEVMKPETPKRGSRRGKAGAV